jgi:cation transport regulator ChaC
MDGKVIGITVKKVADGISYSIPIDDAVESLRQALDNRELGVEHTTNEVTMTIMSIARIQHTNDRKNKKTEAEFILPHMRDGIPISIRKTS